MLTFDKNVRYIVKIKESEQDFFGYILDAGHTDQIVMALENPKKSLLIVRVKDVIFLAPTVKQEFLKEGVK